MYKKDINSQDNKRKGNLRKIRRTNENEIDDEDENIGQDEMGNENNDIPEQDQDRDQVQTFNNNRPNNNLNIVNSQFQNLIIFFL